MLLPVPLRQTLKDKVQLSLMASRAPLHCRRRQRYLGHPHPHRPNCVTQVQKETVIKVFVSVLVTMSCTKY